MSYRNPFVTSYLYRTTEEERDAIGKALEQAFGVSLDRPARFYAGLHTRAHPGALQMEELEYLTDALRAAGVATPFRIVFAGEAEADQITYTYSP